MTCVVGLVHDGKVFIGGDSAATCSNDHQCTRVDGKVFKRAVPGVLNPHGEENMVLAFSSSFRAGQLLRYVFMPPDHDSGPDHEYMVVKFVSALRKLYAENGVMHKREEVEDAEVEILVGYRGHLFVIFSDFQVQESREPYAATGSAMDLAVGAVGALQLAPYKLGPEDTVLTALTVSALHNSSVRAPFTVMSV